MNVGEVLGILLGVIGLGGGLIVYFLSGPSALLESMGIYSLICCLLGILFYNLAELIQFYIDSLFEKIDLNLKTRINNAFVELFKFRSKNEKINIINLILWYLQGFLVSINKIYSESMINLIADQEFFKKISSNTFYDKKLSRIIILYDRFEKLKPYNKEVFLFAKNKMNKQSYFDYFKFNSKSNAFMFIIRLI
jgi:hypothetical protein